MGHDNFLLVRLHPLPPTGRIALLLRSPVFSDHSATPETNYAVGGGWTTYTLPPGEYLLLAASAPAESGTATLHLKVLGSADVLASQAGESFWARGYDLSETKYDVHAISARGLYARAWSYSGADAPVAIAGRMFGYLGYHGGQSHWEGPSPSQFGFIQDGEPGAYTASFPTEEYQGPFCLPAYGCDPAFGDTREDPPFAIAVDIRV